MLSCQISGQFATNIKHISFYFDSVVVVPGTSLAKLDALNWGFSMKHISKFIISIATIMLSISSFAGLAFPIQSQGLLDVTAANVASVSDSQVTVNIVGYLPNACYGWSHVEVTHDHSNHYVRTLANIKPNICTQALIDFSKTIVLGDFEKGVHSIVFLNRTLPPLKISVEVP
jgi:hypothetical protein